MRLEELYLDGFGHFHQRIFSFSPEGKPVTHLSVPSCLVWPTQRRNEHYPPLSGDRHGGRIRLSLSIYPYRPVWFSHSEAKRALPAVVRRPHGGRIRLSGDDGEIYTLERYVGARGGSLTVRDGADDPVDPTDFMPCITGQATQAMFTNVFASVSTNSSRWGCWTTPRLARQVGLLGG